MRLVSKIFSGRKCFPSVLCLKALLGFVLFQSLVVFWFQLWRKVETPAEFYSLGVALVAVWVVVLLADLFLVGKQNRIKVERRISGSAAVNRWTKVELRLHHDFSRPVQIVLFENFPGNVEFESNPVSVELLPEKFSRQRYRLKPLVRGPLDIAGTYLRVPSPLGLWTTQYIAENYSRVKVYPDFSSISAYTILATDNHVSQIGIKKKPRRGEGLEFLQLREYRRGDSLRQIDWNATSRRNELISKEYQDERDQQIVLMVDSGRRMRAIDDNLSHFDHSLNALLLVSHIALKQGDSASVLSFGSSHRWVAPQKGMASMKTILNGMYDLHAENCAPDYVAAAEKLVTLQRKRSLVILVTNTRDEEVEELMMAVNLLRKNHLVLLANIRESVIDSLENTEVVNLRTALNYAGVHHYLATRNEVQQKIRNNGIYLVDCLAEELAVRVANSYLEIKSAGVL